MPVQYGVHTVLPSITTVPRTLFGERLVVVGRTPYDILGGWKPSVVATLLGGVRY